MSPFYVIEFSIFFIVVAFIMVLVFVGLYWYYDAEEGEIEIHKKITKVTMFAVALLIVLLMLIVAKVMLILS